MERPLSTTPEAAVLRQVFKFFGGNLFWLASGVAAGVFLGWAVQYSLPLTYEAEGSFVVDEVPFLQTSTQNIALPDHDTVLDMVQSLILGIPSSNMRSETAARLEIPENQICFEDISSHPLSLKSREPVANIRVSPVKNSRTGTISVCRRTPGSPLKLPMRCWTSWTTTTWRKAG